MAVLTNTMLQGTSADTGAGDYQIPASIKFNSKHRNSLERYQKYEGDTRTWTLATWIKADSSKQPSYIFGSFKPPNSGKEFAVGIDNDRLAVVLTDEKVRYTNLKLRDPSAWWHLVIAVNTSMDSGNGIEYVKIYINGKRVHSFQTSSGISQDTQLHWNQEHTTTYIGASRYDRFGDCQLADTYHIDGLQLSPSTFGKFDAANNWVPKDPKDADGNFILPVVNDGTVWLDYLTYYNDTEANGYPIKQIFDQSITLRGGNGQASADNHFTLTPPNAWEDVDTFEIFFDHVYTQTKYRLKSGSTWGEWNDFLGAEGHTGVNHGWEDCSMNIVDRNVSAVEIRPKSGETTVMYLGGFKVNGIQLVDGWVDPDQLRNPNDNTTWNATSGTLLDNYGGIYNGDTVTSGATVSSTARTLFDDDIVVNRQFAMMGNDGTNNTITLTDADSNVYAFRVGNDTYKWMILNSDSSASTKTPFTGTLKGPVTIKQTSGSSTILCVKLDGYRLQNTIRDNSFHLKYNETANATQLGHDAFVNSETDTNPYYSGLIAHFQNRTAWKGFDGTASSSSYVAGPNHGGIGVVDFTPLGGVAYNSLEVYMEQKNTGQYDAYRLNQSGSFTDVPTSGGWGWITVDSNSGTLNTFEWRDSTNNSVNGAAEGIFSALRINGDTILTDRGGNNFKVNNMHTATDNGLTVTGTGSGFTGNSADNIFDGDTSTHTTFGSSYCTITDKTINVIEKIEVYTNSGPNNNQPDYFKDGNGTEYQIYNTGSTAWHKVTCTNASQSGEPLRGKIKGPWQIKRTSGGSHLYGVKVDGVWLQDIGKTYTDSLVDSPTNYGTDAGAGAEVRGNYCTVNPLTNIDWGYGSWTISEGNLTAHASNGTSNRIGCTMGASSGKWYWEVETEYNSGTGAIGIGINAANTDYHADWNTGDYAVYLTGSNNNGGKHRAGSSTDWGDEIANGDVIGVQWDADNGSIYFWRNGVIQESGAAAFTGLSGTYVPCGISTSSIQNNTLHFNFGQRAFKYTNAGTNRPSADYKCLCTQNLDDTFSGAELNNPSKYFDVQLITSTGVNDRQIKGWNFGPDLVWTKSRNQTYNHKLYDKTRGTNNSLYANGNDVKNTSANQLSAWRDDGFDLGTNSNVQYDTGNTGVIWGWDAGTAAATASTDGNITPSAQWVNATAGFSITLYSGFESAGKTVGHGLGAKPDFVMCKNTLATRNWVVWHNALDKDEHLILNTNDDVETSTTVWDNLDFTNTVVTLGANEDSNRNGNPTVMYAWTAIPGYSAFGSYTGTGVDPNFVYLGFSPKFLMVKGNIQGENWCIWDSVRTPNNQTNAILRASTNGAETESEPMDKDLLSNGFCTRSTSTVTNTNGTKYYYAAFAEHPFKTARAQ